jgi:hypothetical protein
MRAISSPGFASRSARVGGLPPHQAAPPGPTRILQSGPQAVYLLPMSFGFSMLFLMQSINPGGHVARMLPFGLQFALEPFGG